jgi:integrase
MRKPPKPPLRKTLTDRFLIGIKPITKGQVDIWDALIPGFGVRVGVGGRKTFCALTRIRGKVKRVRLGHYPALSLKDARLKAAQVLKDAQEGVDPTARAVIEAQAAEAADAGTFAALAERYMREYAATFRTHHEVRRKIETELLPNWGARQVASITRDDVKTLAYAKAEDGAIASNRLLALITTIFNFAVDEGYVSASPAARIKKIGKETDRDRVLTESEIRIVWDACDRLGYPFGKLFQMSLVTGQRRGECASMRWRDIDERGWLIPAEHFKTDHSHHVQLSALAREILASITPAGQFVFHGRVDARLQGWSKAKADLDALCETPVEDFVIHDLRRTAATHMRGLGIDRLVVSKILGHSEGGITRIYDRHSADLEKLAAVERWATKLRSIITDAGAEVIELRRIDTR